MDISVGIMHGDSISFVLHGDFMCGAGRCRGEQTVAMSGGKILWNGCAHDELLFQPCAGSEFTLRGVTIGIGFHWERREDQLFSGNLRFIVHGGKVCAVNVLDIEDYLLSVISSEMSPTASEEFLKAHAVISRSWALRRIMRHDTGKATAGELMDIANPGDGVVRIIKWYDDDDHDAFDVCADDHCQRYQGLSRASKCGETWERVRRVIDATKGEVLMYGEEVCDARFSKCCGGMMEEFQYCWDNIRKPYLVAKPDCVSPMAGHFCNTSDARILSQVLNGYDQETSDFYSWTVRYSQEVLSELVRRKSGIDFGKILDLQPVERGKSGRIWLLRIVGEKCTVEIGKELEIRKWLSESHLYSSAFGIEVAPDSSAFTLRGKGWGHGVGLCQIGAAVMGDRGYKYADILEHYYPGAKKVKR